MIDKDLLELPDPSCLVLILQLLVFVECLYLLDGQLFVDSSLIFDAFGASAKS